MSAPTWIARAAYGAGYLDALADPDEDRVRNRARWSDSEVSR